MGRRVRPQARATLPLSHANPAQCESLDALPNLRPISLCILLPLFATPSHGRSQYVRAGAATSSARETSATRLRAPRRPSPAVSPLRFSRRSKPCSDRPRPRRRCTDVSIACMLRGGVATAARRWVADLACRGGCMINHAEYLRFVRACWPLPYLAGACIHPASSMSTSYDWVTTGDCMCGL